MGAVRQAGAAVARWFGQSPARVWAVIFGLYLIGRVILMAGGHVFVSYDAITYAPRPGQPDDGLLSLTGQAPRPWGLPLFYAAFGSDEARAWGQWAVGTFAWAFFAWEVGRHLRTRTARYATVAAILFLALLHAVANWDLAILSESLSLSLGVLVLGLLLRWIRTGSIPTLAGMTAVALWWTFLRPDIRVFTAVLIGVLALAAARGLWPRLRVPGLRARKGTFPYTRRQEGAPQDLTRTRAAVAALASCLVLGGAIVWYAAITPAMEQTMYRYDGDAIVPPLPQDEHRLVYRLRVDVSTNPELWHAFKTELGMPTCPELEAFTSDTLQWRGREWAEAYTRCAPLVEWVHEHKDEYFWTGLATTNPGLFLKSFVKELSLTLGGDIYADVPQVVPAPVEKLVFPSRRYGLPLALLGFAATFALAWWAGAARAGASRAHRRLVCFAAVIFGTALLSAVATIVMVTGELQRFGVQETIATRIAMLVLLGCALDAWLGRRGGRSPETAEDPAVAKAADRPDDENGGVSSTGAARTGPAQAAA